MKILYLLFLFIVLTAAKMDPENQIPSSDVTDSNDFKPASTIIKEYDAAFTKGAPPSPATNPDSDSDKDEL